jgi:hypothetical protein
MSSSYCTVCFCCRRLQCWNITYRYHHTMDTLRPMKWRRKGRSNNIMMTWWWCNENERWILRWWSTNMTMNTMTRWNPATVTLPFPVSFTHHMSLWHSQCDTAWDTLILTIQVPHQCNDNNVATMMRTRMTWRWWCSNGVMPTAHTCSLMHNVNNDVCPNLALMTTWGNCCALLFHQECMTVTIYHCLALILFASACLAMFPQAWWLQVWVTWTWYDWGYKTHCTSTTLDSCSSL